MIHAKYLLLSASMLLLLPLRGQAGQPLELSLDDAITMARTKSLDAAVALDELRSAYWEWRSFRADQLPELKFNATLPSYRKEYSSYMNENGDYSFVRTNTLQANAEISMTQNIALTGGKISLSSSLDFLRQLDSPAYNRFMSIPVALSLEQPLFGVNTMKWDRRIEPVRYAEAKAAFLSATENVARLTVEYYFDLLMSRENLSIAEQNLENAERLFAVAREKREMGKISKNDLLQMELNVLDARSQLTDCTSQLKSSMFNLRSFLDLDEDTEILPQVPAAVPSVHIDYVDALERATENNKFMKTMRRTQLEADYDVAKAKGKLREINVFARIGYSGTDDNIGDSYGHLRSNQVASVGISIPLVDWGKRRGQVKVAESRRRVAESRIRQETMNFNQELFILVERFTNQQEQLDIAERAAEIAETRYATNVETYLIGMLSPLELNDSRTSKDSSRRDYISQLFKFWNYWYQIRSLTLHDYSEARDINSNIEKIVKDSAY